MTMNNKFATMAVVDEDEVPQVVSKKAAPKKAAPTKEKKVQKAGGAMDDGGFESIGAKKY